MIGYPYGALSTGLCLLAASIMIFIRQWLLEPHVLEYPKAPAWLRNCMFAFGTVLAFLGLHFLWVFLRGSPNVAPPQPTGPMQFLVMALCFHQAAMLFNILRQNYPADVWAKLNRINERLSCRGGRFAKFWAWLGR